MPHQDAAPSLQDEYPSLAGTPLIGQQAHPHELPPAASKAVMGQSGAQAEPHSIKPASPAKGKTAHAQKGKPKSSLAGDPPPHAEVRMGRMCCMGRMGTVCSIIAH